MINKKGRKKVLYTPHRGQHYIKKRLESRINPSLFFKSFWQHDKNKTQLTIDNY